MSAGKNPQEPLLESFDVHLSLIYKKRPEHKANEAK